MAQRYNPTTVYGTVGELNRILDFMRERGAPHLKTRRKNPKRRSIAPTEEELQRIYEAALPWEKCWFILQAELGLRISEARQVCAATHSPEKRTITVIGKGSRPRTLPTTDELEHLFALAPPANETTPLIYRLRGAAITLSGMARRWRKLLVKTGARYELRPHDLRRRAATQVYNHTHDLRAAQQLLGHDHLETTVRYMAHYDPDKLRPLIEALRIRTEVKQ